MIRINTKYIVRKPGWIRRLYGSCIWEMPSMEKSIYLTFDDGPHPEATPFVLEQLKRFQAKGTFFCLGKNVKTQSSLYRQIRDEGHSVGNHSYSHLDGWKTLSEKYYNDIAEARQLINSDLYRPPYGHITPWQLKRLEKSGLRVVMWSVLSGDFDSATSPENCYRNVASHMKSGAIVVFHDNSLALPNLLVVLPKILAEYSEKGYRFEAIR